MNARERVLMTLNHREPDRVPFDLGGTYVTGIHIKAYRSLREFMSLPPSDLALMDEVQQIVWVDEDVLQDLAVDVKTVSTCTPSNYQPLVLDGGDYTHFYDQFRIGWRMPKEGGFYYDLFDHPLQGSITEANVDAFPWPDPLDPVRYVGLREAIQHVINQEQRAVTVGFFHAGMMELCAFMRGYSDYFADFTGNPSLIGKLMDRILEMQLAYWKRVFDVAGDSIDVALIHDDFAGQSRMLISPSVYRRLCKPRHRQLISLIRSRSKAKIFFHSCGAIRPVIPDLIEIGVDILNPVQVSAKDMNSAELKREYGKDLVFWGGGVDTQHVLGNGTPQQVRDEVKRRLADLMPGGGFVFSAVHNIQANVPPQNIMAMWETLVEYGQY